MSPRQLAHREYLKSAVWKDIRNEVLKRDNFICCRCKINPASEVHHKHYRNWMNEKLEDLESLCGACHSAHHSSEKGTKTKCAIGTKALFSYLTKSQKEVVMEKFHLQDENELYFAIEVNENRKICKFAANLLGYDNFYSQRVKKKIITKENKRKNRKRKK